MSDLRDSRLDEILVKLGYVTGDQIKRALSLQMGRGGRLGTHLLQQKDLTESQLSQALALQYGTPAFVPERYPVSPELVARLPREMIEGLRVMPLDFNPSNGVLSLVMVDPADDNALREVRRRLSCAEVEVYVTPEATFEQLVRTHVPAASDRDGADGAIELPDLFDSLEDTAATPESGTTGDEASENVLMISRQVFLGKFLTPVLQREGLHLTTACEPAEIAALLRKGVDRVLVDRDLSRSYRSWIRRGDLPQPAGDVSEFVSVGSALLDNPVAYGTMRKSLLQSLRMVAETHAAHGAATLPYDLLRRDAGALARSLGMTRLAGDALELACLLLVPREAGSVDEEQDAPPTIDWSRTLEQARTLRFPWRIPDALQACHELQNERVNLEEFCSRDGEVALAAQILAVVWHHRVQLEPRAGGGDYALAMRTELRDRSGRLARSEVVESYLGLLERSAEDLNAAAYHQLMVVGGDHPVLRQFTTRLQHLGYHPVHVQDLQEARAMCERRSPSAVLVHDASFPHDILLAPQVMRTESRMLQYALTEDDDPSRVLNLLDAGFDDVFSLPHDLDLIAARLRKSLRGTDASAGDGSPDGSFGASFTALPFTDLLQTLSQSQRSVRIRVSRNTGEEAVIHLKQGCLTHAACERISGPEAIYAVVAWENDGEFEVEPVEEFPAPNIEIPLESVLMEGCRLLDELLRA